MVNEAFGWLCITTGFVTGIALGAGFRGEQWLGGYASWRRRLLRLGHISLFGLGLLNILFALSSPRIHLDEPWLRAASWAFVIGGISMPLACALAAWRKASHPVFAVPVTALVFGGAATSIGLLR